ncbi:hypothetical protein QOZ80_7AG0580350 [Eleusine coracana subsp. coracana]|nr:hypothetical protein QOZ80_7AG0580350 [Eleusine coracana subsp. coracana]
MDLKRPNGTHAKEIIRRKKWHRSILRKRWEELRAWINADDAVAEFGCYMPAYICLGILGVVSPIVFTDSAQDWPNDLVVLFYTFGGISFFLCLFILIGLTCRQPKTRAELNKWRVICIIAVATGVVFLALHAVYGRLDLVKNRKPKEQGTDVVD